MDEQLVARILQNDQRAMGLLYQRYVGILTSVCYRYVAQESDVKDVLQNSFVKIFTSLPTFKFRGEDSLKAWMTRIVVNESLNFLQSRKKLLFVEDERILRDLPDEEEVNLDRISDDELHQLIRELPDGCLAVSAFGDGLYLLKDRVSDGLAEFHFARTARAVESGQHICRGDSGERI